MPALCIDLKKLFGKQFRVCYEESYHADKGEGARAADPWLMILLCQHEPARSNRESTGRPTLLPRPPVGRRRRDDPIRRGGLPRRGRNHAAKTPQAGFGRAAGQIDPTTCSRASTTPDWRVWHERRMRSDGPGRYSSRSAPRNALATARTAFYVTQTTRRD